MNRYVTPLMVVVVAFGVGCTYSLQQQKQESAPAEPLPPPTAPVGATLLPGLGTYTFPVTSSNSAVQRWFDQGLALSYGFNHDAAERSFLKAAELDPNCAMCWWGAALVLGPHVNAPMNPANNANAWTRIKRAQQLASTASPREQRFINALSTRYADQPPADRKSLDEAYAVAMEQLKNAFPGDQDAATLSAEAMMDLQPWNYYEGDGTPKGNTAKVVSTLESVMARNPDHPGALHLYIHAVEASKDPARGVAAADRLSTLLPGSGHLVHMPSHIYTRVGRYHDAVIANQKAASADDSYLATCRPGVAIYPLAYVPHNHHFLWWASSMEGNGATAIAAADEAAKRASVEQLIRVPQFIFLQNFMITPIKARAQFGRWSEIAAIPRPDADLGYPIAFWHYAQGMAAVRQGRLSDADQHLTELTAASQDPVWDKAFIGPQHTVGGSLRIAQNVLQGEVSAARKDYSTALSALEQGVALEDAQSYYEPPIWHQPVRQTLGAVQLMAGKARDAEATYREDLARNPENGWSLFGLSQALRAQKRSKDAAAAEARFQRAWAHADVKLTSSRL